MFVSDERIHWTRVCTSIIIINIIAPSILYNNGSGKNAVLNRAGARQISYSRPDQDSSGLWGYTRRWLLSS